MFKADLQLSPLGLKDLQSEGKSDLDQLVLFCQDSLSTLLDKHAPLKTRSFVARPKLPWFNGSVTEAKKANKRAKKKWHSSKNENDKDNCKSKRNEYLYLLNTAKQKCFSDYIEESQGDQRKLFKLVKSIMKPEDNVTYPASSSMKNLNDEFNDYFITKIDLLREELDEIEMDTSPSEY